jgi:hypothetical protein
MHEAQQLADLWYTSKLGAFPCCNITPPLTQTRTEPAAAVEWHENYWELMEALDAHRSFITLALTRCAFCPNMHTLALTLKVGAVLVLSGLSALLSLFAHDQIELRRKKLDAVNEIVSISTTFTEEDCAYLDPILSVSHIRIPSDTFSAQSQLLGVLDGDNRLARQVHWLRRRGGGAEYA